MIAGWRRSFAAALLGTLLLQAAWMLVVPPFRGLDEHDHAYKAAAVAHGDWGWDHEPSPEGWGEFVVVPRELVVAAGPVCRKLPYTTPDNCSASGSPGGTMVEVASSAARYNPVFYGLVGAPARAFDGVGALYAMRAAAALLCALLIAAAAATTARWAASPWPGVAMLLALTPMFGYSTAMAAPNGIEVAGALLVWSSLAGLARHRDRSFPPDLAMALGTLGAVPLVLVRTMGPLWLVLIAGAAIALRPDLPGLLVSRRAGRLCLLVIALAATCGAGWTLLASTNSAAARDGDFGQFGLADLPGHLLLWVVQSIGAFPARDELAPPAVYVIVLILWWVVSALAFRAAGRRERWVAGLVAASSAAVPIAVTVVTYDALGSAWQGRYGYPVALGVLVLAGLALDRRPPGALPLSPTLLVTGAGMAVAHLVSQLAVLADQERNSPLTGTGAWWVPPAWLPVAMTVAGIGVLALSLRPLATENYRPRLSRGRGAADSLHG